MNVVIKYASCFVIANVKTSASQARWNMLTHVSLKPVFRDESTSKPPPQFCMRKIFYK